MNQFSSNLHTVYGKKRKLLLVTITAFFLFSFLKTNGQNPTVTINQSAAQPDPTNSSPINFTVLFDQPVIGFATGDVVLSGTAGAIGAVVTGGPMLFNVSAFGMISCGTVIANIPAGVCTNTLTQPNLASTSIDNTVTLLTGNPNVTINQAASQPDPTNQSPINFTVQFDQLVTGFATGDVTLSGTAGATTALVIGSGAIYNVAVSGMTASGTVIATIAAGVAQACSQPNNASTSTDNTVTITCVPPIVNVSPTVSCGGTSGSGPCNPLTASGNADTYIWTPLAGLYTNCPATIPYTGQNLSTVYAAPTVNTTYTVTGGITATGCYSSATVQVNYTAPAPVVIPPSVNMCLGDPPVRLQVLTPAGSTQFCSGVINIPVPDNNTSGASSTIAVAGIPAGCTITGMNVNFYMPHTRAGNMVFVLKAPNGQIINLDYHLTATGGAGSTTGFTNTVISSTGTVALSAGTNPYTATFKADAQTTPAGGFGASGPTGMLPTTTNWNSLFTGPVNGNWTLGFYDGVTGDVGNLTYWCLNFNLSCASILPATPAVWSPAAGLYLNSTATVPYVAGTQVNNVWVGPFPAGVYTYQVTTQSVPTLLCTPATNFIGNNGNESVTFNVRNNHPYPIKLYQVNSKTITADQTSVSVYYKTSAINGPPGFISASNGWNQFGSASIAGTGTGTQPFLTNLQLVIPPGMTYGICLRAHTATSVPNLVYSGLSAGNYSYNDGGCELITGTNIGYSGNTNTPATPLSGFVGSVQFADASATCTSPPTTVTVNVGQTTTITSQPVNAIVCSAGGVATFSVTAAGAGPFTYQWQVSSNGPWNNISNGGLYSGATTPTLTITNPPASMNGYYYRVVINGTATCGTTSSMLATLTVNVPPTPFISGYPLVIGPLQTSTIIANSIISTPPNILAWYYNNTLLPGETSTILHVNYGSPGDYQLRVTDANNCGVGVSNIVSIANSFASNMLTYPNPSGGIFEVRYNSEPNNTLQRSLSVYNNRGEKIITRNFTQTIPYQKIEVDVRAHGKGLYWVEVRDANGKRLGMNRVVVQ
jgi:subtilisin-like proprotein convertase family protein